MKTTLVAALAAAALCAALLEAQPSRFELAFAGLAEGMDADITVFDPATVVDRATFAQPAQASGGIPHVIVNGTFVLRDGKLIADARPGARDSTAGRRLISESAALTRCRGPSTS